MSKDYSKKPRITVRLSENQMQVLREIREALGVSYSMLVRTIILQFLQQNEERLERIIENYEKTGKSLAEENPILNNIENFD